MVPALGTFPVKLGRFYTAGDDDGPSARSPPGAAPAPHPGDPCRAPGKGAPELDEAADEARHPPARAGDRRVVRRTLQAMRVGHVGQSFHPWPWGVLGLPSHMRPPQRQQALYQGTP